MNAKIYIQSFYEHIFIHLASVELIRPTVLKGLDQRQGEQEVAYCWQLIKNTAIKCVSKNIRQEPNKFLAPYIIVLLLFDFALVLNVLSTSLYPLPTTHTHTLSTGEGTMKNWVSMNK